MALPESGPISFNDLNLELRGLTNEQISLTSAATGEYIAINQASTLKPDGIPPHSMSEFRGYDQSAIPPIFTSFFMDETGYGDDQTACMVGSATTELYHDGNVSLPTIFDNIYYDSNGDVPFSGDDLWYFVDDGGNGYTIRILDGVVVGEVVCR